MGKEGSLSRGKVNCHIVALRTYLNVDGLDFYKLWPRKLFYLFIFAAVVSITCARLQQTEPRFFVLSEQTKKRGWEGEKKLCPNEGSNPGPLDLDSSA